MRDGKSIIDMIEPIPSTDGVSHYSNTSKYLLRDTSGNVIGLYGLGRDITEYRTAFERLKLLTDNIPGGIGMFEVSLNGIRVMYYNDGFFEYSGYTKEEFDKNVIKDPLFLVFEEDRAAVYECAAAMRNNIDGTVNCSYRCRTKHGGYRWFNVKGRVSEVRGTALIVNIVKFDITEVKLAEESQRIHEEEMKIAISRLGKMICEYNPATRVLTLPEVYAERYGVQTRIRNIPEAAEQLGVFDSAYLQAYNKFYGKIRSGEKTGAVELRLKQKDGTIHWQQHEFINIFGVDNKPLKTIISVEDVTEHKEIKRRYEHEMQLRHELIGDCLIYYLMNLTTGVIEEYRSVCSDVPSMVDNAVANDDMRSQILNNIVEEDRETVRNTIFVKALREAFSRGETGACAEYRRTLPGAGIVWVRADAKIMERPNTDEIVAFLYIRNIDMEKKDGLALEAIFNDGIKSVCIIDVKSGMAHLAKQSASVLHNTPDKQFDYEKNRKMILESADYVIENSEDFEKLSLKNLKELLESTPEVMLYFNLRKTCGKCGCYMSKVFYLDDSKSDIVISTRDITELYGKILPEQ